jgi:phage tail-like protein
MLAHKMETSNNAFYPSVSFSFLVSIQGIKSNAEAAFQEASGIDMEMGAEEVVSGGENQFKYRLPNEARFNNLVLKRGLVPKESALATWAEETLLGGLSTSVTTKTIMVGLMDSNREILVSWSFFNAYPVKWNISDFKSMENSYVVETIEFAYNYFKKNS